MADKKISQLTAATTPLDGTEVLPIVQAGSTVKVANNALLPKQIQSNATSGVMQIVGPAASTTRVMTIPNANFTAARTDAAQTFTGLQQFNAGVQTNNETDVVFATASSATGEKSVVQWLIEDGSEMSSIRSSRVNAGGDGSLDFYTRGSGPSTLAAKINQFGTLRFERDNAYFAVAGKGVDFGANSTAAGMTSTLLNWYEEGTWTPTVTTSVGSITTYSTNAKYTRIGRLVTLTFTIAITTNGTGAGALFVEGMPFAAANSSFDAGCGRENGNTGVGLVVAFGTTTKMIVNKYDGTYPGANGNRLDCTITYIV